MTTPTPRTDAAQLTFAGVNGMVRYAVPADFARQLERELVAAQSELASVKAHAEAMAQLIRMFTWMDKHGVQLPAGLYAQVSEYEAAVLAFRRDFPKETP